MNVNKVYTRIQLRNLKRAKLKQKQAELELHIKKGETELTDETRKEIRKLEKEIERLF